MRNPSFRRHPVPQGPAPCPGGDPPNPICLLKREGRPFADPQHVTCEDAAGGPHVNGRGVQLGPKEDIGWAVPQCDHLEETPPTRTPHLEGWEEEAQRGE